LDVWMNGEHVAVWAVSAQGRHVLRYTAAWLDSTLRRPLSLSLPLGTVRGEHHGAVVAGFFDNLLPDAREIRSRVQQRFGARSTQAFDLLEAIGRDCVGAVQLLPEGEPPPGVRRIRGVVLSDGDIADVLRGVTSTLPFRGRHGGDPFRISLAGAQEKTALLRHRESWLRPLGATPTTHIFKLPIGPVGRGGIDLSQSVENEWLCMQLLRELDLPVAECRIERFEEHRVLVVQRFDRRLSSDGRWIVRQPQEDLCQALGIGPDRKYEADGGPGILRTMDLLLGSRNAEDDRRTFLRAQIAGWLLAAPDGHGKNFSIFLEAQGRYRLTPLYDVLSAYPFLGKGTGRIAPQELRMAMAVSGRNRHYEWSRITPRHWRDTAQRCGMGAHIDDLLHGLLERVPAAIDSAARTLPSRFPAGIAEPILAGVRKAAANLGGAR
jgi:serine/threonine-protein kinase HipA